MAWGSGSWPAKRLSSGWVEGVIAMDGVVLGRLMVFGSAVVVGTAASAIAPIVPIAIAGTALASVAGGIFANELGALNVPPGDPDLRNAHLTRAIGRAVGMVIRTVAADEKKRGRDRRSRVALEALAQAAREDWETLSHDLVRRERLTALDEKQLADRFFSTAAADFESLRALDRKEDWLPVLAALREPARRRLRRSWRQRVQRWRQGAIRPLEALHETDWDRLAKALHELFPKAIREVLKQDFAQGKASFAGMAFDLLGNLTQEVRALRDRAGGGEAAQLEALLAQLQRFEDRDVAQLRALAGQIDSGFDHVLAALNLQQVRVESLLADSFASVLDWVAQEGEETRARVQAEHEETRALIRARFNQPPLPDSPCPTNLPRYRRTVPKFVGREVAMDELTALVQENAAVAIAAAVSGMGGLGKTELAWQWAWQASQAGHFPGGVVWVDMAAGNPGEQLVRFYQTEFDVKIPTELAELDQRVAYCWQHWRRPGAVLVVLDDVVRQRDGSQLAMFQPGGAFRVLWTTREEWSGVKRYPLDRLSDAAARELLASYLDPARLDAEPEAVAGLLRWFGGLPLGLELAARYLALYRPLKLAQYLKDLSLTHKSLTKEQREEMGYPHGLEAALALSWGRLESDAARRLAMRFGLYGAAPIPLSEEELTDWLEPLVALVNLNLVEQEGDRVRLHPLVRQFVRERLAVELRPTDADALKREVARAIVVQGRRIPQTFTMAQARDYAPWIPHLEAVAAALLPWVADEDAISPLSALDRYYDGQALYAAAEPWSRQGVAVARSRLGNRHPDTAAALNNLALLLRSQGKVGEAEPLFREALAIARESLPPNHPSLATGLNNLALLLRSQGKVGEAEPLYREALAIDRESLPPNHPQLATHLNNLAELLRSQGKFGEAEPLFREALAIDRESLPPNHPQLATHLNNLAELLRSQGKVGEAEPLYREALAIDRESLPPNHPQLATHLNNLAGLLESQGKVGEAEPLYREALAIARESLPPNHPQLATHLNNLAMFYEAQGQYDEAELPYLESLLIKVQALPEDHPSLKSGWYNVLDFYRTALAAGLPDTRLRQHPLGDAIRSRL